MTLHPPARPASARRVLLVFAIGLIVSQGPAPLAFAQGRMPHPAQMKQRLAARTDTLVEQLNLTGAQETPVRAILDEQNEKRLALMTEAREGGSFVGLREKMNALDEETATRLAEVLTAAQMTTYEKIQEENTARRGRRRGM